MRVVTLTLAEASFASNVGRIRNLHSVLSGKTPAYGVKEEECWESHIEGACGECAAAKAMRRYWPASVDTYRTGDDVDGLQIRTRSRHDWDLIIRKPDRDDAIFVLVTGRVGGEYRVHGWIVGGDGKRDEYWKTYNDRPPAWFVPQSALHPLETCPEAT